MSVIIIIEGNLFTYYFHSWFLSTSGHRRPRTGLYACNHSHSHYTGRAITRIIWLLLRLVFFFHSANIFNKEINYRYTRIRITKHLKKKFRFAKSRGFADLGFARGVESRASPRLVC